MAFVVLAAPLAVSGQMPTVLKPIRIGVAAGAAMPISDLGNSFNTGFNVTGTVGIDPAGLPVGFRADVAYNQFGSKGATSVKAKFARRPRRYMRRRRRLLSRRQRRTERARRIRRLLQHCSPRERLPRALRRRTRARREFDSSRAF